MDKELYIGKEKVKDYIVHEGTNLVGVLFENGKSEDYTNEQWTNLKSEEPYDNGLISLRKHEKLIQRIIKEMLDSRVTLGEHGWILERADEAIGKNYKEAISKVFGVKFPEKILLSQIDLTLKE